MEIIKRDGSLQPYDRHKIKQAILKVFMATNNHIEQELLDVILNEVEVMIQPLTTVEMIQDLVEEGLMKAHFYKEAKSYILYRQQRFEKRKLIDELVNLLHDESIRSVLLDIQKDFKEDVYDLEHLLLKFRSFVKDGMHTSDCLNMMIKAAVELISKEAPKWENIAAYFLAYKLHDDLNGQMGKLNIHNFYDKLCVLSEMGLYGTYILENYTKDEILTLEAAIDNAHDRLFTYSGLDIVMKRYLICSYSHVILESPQEMFMGIAMHLAMKEENKVFWAKEIYTILSTLKATMATPTMSNARKPYHQLSSCFIDTVDDTLANIYKSVDNFAKVSKFGGGMGMYFGKVRANGSDIRGFEGAAGGIIRWIKLVNDTATAVDQLGVRQGAVAVYLDAWHKDLPEFLNLRTNNGDDRMKAHDVFPAICYPDLFWKMAKEDLNATWYLMCPHEIHKIKGYHLEDSFGEEWEKRYFECVQDSRISKREISMKDCVRLIIKSAVETGTPFTFNRDHVNRMNPNPHQGIIYCSNLCTEIAQNMSALEILESKIVEVNNETIIVDQTKPGDFVVCNLASLTLGHLNVLDKSELSHTIEVIVRALDNVIDLNFYPIPYAKVTNHRYRPIGLGVSGYHHLLVKHGLQFESDAHLEFVDKLFEEINYYTIQASTNLAHEKGSYSHFNGSDWHTGDYFKKRAYSDEKWLKLGEVVAQQGMRNGYLLAIAPTSSTSIISGTTAGVDPIMNKYFLEEKKGSMIARVAPDLNSKTYWLYKNAHLIDQSWIVKSAGIRQRHIDQAQSVNLYITNEFTFRRVLDLYIQAWVYGVKTLYYVRSKSLEVEECESCAA